MQKLEGRPLGQQCLCSQRLVGLIYKDFSVAFIGFLFGLFILSNECMTKKKCARVREVAAQNLPD